MKKITTKGAANTTKTSAAAAGTQAKGKIPSFEPIWQRALKLKGGRQALGELLPEFKTAQQLARVGDDRILAEMTKCIFRSGFVWQIVENKWPDFEAAFHQFDVAYCRMLSDEDLERLMKNPKVIRNAAKLKSVRDNAGYIFRVREKHGSFGKFLAQWPAIYIIGLWEELKANGSRLGGNTGLFFLRFIGKDTFILSQDVVKVLVQSKVVSKKPTSKKDLVAVQAVFNAWHDETGLPYCHLSRIAAQSVG